MRRLDPEGMQRATVEMPSPPEPAHGPPRAEDEEGDVGDEEEGETRIGDRSAVLARLPVPRPGGAPAAKPRSSAVLPPAADREERPR
jgi:hypothetical protein